MEITEEKLKKILDGQRDEFQHCVEKGLQELHPLLDNIVEQYQDIKSTLAGHTEILGSLMKDMKIIKADLEFIKSNFF